MSEEVDARGPAVSRKPPSALLRSLMRAPIWFYRGRMGFLFGKRFLHLTHVGRKSGKRRETVLEVVDHDPHSGTFTVASGFGDKADWFRNIVKTPEVDLIVGTRKFRARAVHHSVDEAHRILADYARRHPRAFRNVAKFSIGEKLEATDGDIRRMAEAVPIVTFHPI